MSFISELQHETNITQYIPELNSLSDWIANDQSINIPVYKYHFTLRGQDISRISNISICPKLYEDYTTKKWSLLNDFYLFVDEFNELVCEIENDKLYNIYLYTNKNYDGSLIISGDPLKFVFKSVFRQIERLSDCYNDSLLSNLVCWCRNHINGCIFTIPKDSEFYRTVNRFDYNQIDIYNVDGKHSVCYMNNNVLGNLLIDVGVKCDAIMKIKTRCDLKCINFWPFMRFLDSYPYNLNNKQLKGGKGRGYLNCFSNRTIKRVFNRLGLDAMVIQDKAENWYWNSQYLNSHQGKPLVKLVDKKWSVSTDLESQTFDGVMYYYNDNRAQSVFPEFVIVNSSNYFDTKIEMVKIEGLTPLPYKPYNPQNPEQQQYHSFFTQPDTYYLENYSKGVSKEKRGAKLNKIYKEIGNKKLPLYIYDHQEFMNKHTESIGFNNDDYRNSFNLRLTYGNEVKMVTNTKEDQDDIIMSNLIEYYRKSFREAIFIDDKIIEYNNCEKMAPEMCNLIQYIKDKMTGLAYSLTGDTKMYLDYNMYLPNKKICEQRVQGGVMMYDYKSDPMRENVYLDKECVTCEGDMVCVWGSILDEILRETIFDFITRLYGEINYLNLEIDNAILTIIRNTIKKTISKQSILGYEGEGVDAFVKLLYGITASVRDLDDQTQNELKLFTNYIFRIYNVLSEEYINRDDIISRCPALFLSGFSGVYQNNTDLSKYFMIVESGNSIWGYNFKINKNQCELIGYFNDTNETIHFVKQDDTDVVTYEDLKNEISNHYQRLQDPIQRFIPFIFNNYPSLWVRGLKTLPDANGEYVFLIQEEETDNFVYKNVNTGHTLKLMGSSSIEYDNGNESYQLATSFQITNMTIHNIKYISNFTTFPNNLSIIPVQSQYHTHYLYMNTYIDFDQLNFNSDVENPIFRYTEYQGFMLILDDYCLFIHQKQFEKTLHWSHSHHLFEKKKVVENEVLDNYDNYYLPNDHFYNLRKRFCMLYLKGGSAFRLLLEDLQTTENDNSLKYLDLDRYISNRSDYDLNLVINPFLDEPNYNLLKTTLDNTVQQFYNGLLGIPYPYDQDEFIYISGSTQLMRVFQFNSSMNKAFQQLLNLPIKLVLNNETFHLVQTSKSIPLMYYGYPYYQTTNNDILFFKKENPLDDYISAKAYILNGNTMKDTDTISILEDNANYNTTYEEIMSFKNQSITLEEQKEKAIPPNYINIVIDKDPNNMLVKNKLYSFENVDDYFDVWGCREDFNMDLSQLDERIQIQKLEDKYGFKLPKTYNLPNNTDHFLFSQSSHLNFRETNSIFDLHRLMVKYDIQDMSMNTLEPRDCNILGTIELIDISVLDYASSERVSKWKDVYLVMNDQLPKVKYKTIKSDVAFGKQLFCYNIDGAIKDLEHVVEENIRSGRLRKLEKRKKRIVFLRKFFCLHQSSIISFSSDIYNKYQDIDKCQTVLDINREYYTYNGNYVGLTTSQDDNYFIDTYVKREFLLEISSDRYYSFKDIQNINVVNQTTHSLSRSKMMIKLILQWLKRVIYYDNNQNNQNNQLAWRPISAPFKIIIKKVDEYDFMTLYNEFKQQCQILSQAEYDEEQLNLLCQCFTRDINQYYLKRFLGSYYYQAYSCISIFIHLYKFIFERPIQNDEEVSITIQIQDYNDTPLESPVTINPSLLNKVFYSNEKIIPQLMEKAKTMVNRLKSIIQGDVVLVSKESHDYPMNYFHFLVIETDDRSLETDMNKQIEFLERIKDAFNKNNTNDIVYINNIDKYDDKMKNTIYLATVYNNYVTACGQCKLIWCNKDTTEKVIKSISRMSIENIMDPGKYNLLDIALVNKKVPEDMDVS